MPNETVTRRDAEYIDAQGITIHYSVWAPAQPKAVVQLAHGVAGDESQFVGVDFLPLLDLAVGPEDHGDHRADAAGLGARA